MINVTELLSAKNLIEKKSSACVKSFICDYICYILRLLKNILFPQKAIFVNCYWVGISRYTPRTLMFISFTIITKKIVSMGTFACVRVECIQIVMQLHIQTLY